MRRIRESFLAKGTPYLFAISLSSGVVVCSNSSSRRDCSVSGRVDVVVFGVPCLVAIEAKWLKLLSRAMVAQAGAGSFDCADGFARESSRSAQDDTLIGRLNIFTRSKSRR
jgi:hypothetical protein